MLLRGARQSRGEEAASSGSSLVVQGQDRLFAGTAYTCGHCAERSLAHF